MKTCVINLATRNAWYTKGQTRLLHSLREHGFDGEFLYWIGEESLGAPSHKHVPYAFKTYAFEKAREAGFDLVMWLDCSMFAVKDVRPLFDAIARDGHVMEEAGWLTGQWATDASLAQLGVSRDEAMTIPMFSAGFTGLDLRSDRSREFLRRWHAAAQDGVSFIGPWTNQDGICSADPRVLGHRHDMTVGSIIAHQMGMVPTKPTFMAYDGPGPFAETVCIRARGM